MLKTYLGQGVDGHPDGVLSIIGRMDQLIAVRQMIDVSNELLADHQELERLREAHKGLTEAVDSAICQLVEGVEFEPAGEVAHRVAGELGAALGKARAALGKCAGDMVPHD